jgi:hypothetical protein
MSLRGKSWLWLVIACYGIGVATCAYTLRDLSIPILPAIVICALTPLLIVSPFALPLTAITLGTMRLRKRRAELEAMDDTLADIDPEVAEQKMREYVAARQSLEARIGLVERTHAHDVANATHTLADDDPRGLPHAH